MDTSKIIIGTVGGGRYTVTAPIVKEDYGLYLKIEGLELPQTYEVDFSNSEHNGTSVTMIGNSDGVLIPNQFISSGKNVFAFLYHVGVDYGRTVYKFRIPNKCRPDRTNEQPTPEEQSTIDQCISALNTAVAQTAQDVIDADASAQSASDSADRAEIAEQDAENAADVAHEYADRAETSASQASASAQASAQSASQAEQIKTDVQGMVSDAQGYASASAQSASESANSASQASSSATSASQSATSASGYATSAQTSAQTASGKASEASTSATTASAKATESANSASQALTYKTDAESAKTASQTAQGLAESARDLAQGYASDAQGYAEDAQASAESISASASQIAQNTTDILKAFPTDTASGAVASFSDGADDIPLKSLVVDINPVQDTSSGDPSPDNVCPISGWTGMQLTASGKNLFSYNPAKATTGITTNGTIRAYYPLEVSNCTLSFSAELIDSGSVTLTYINIGMLKDGKLNVLTSFIMPSEIKERTFTFSENEQAVLITASDSALAVTYNLTKYRICVTTGSTPQSYEPYQGRTIPISWQSEAGTVYGGKLDVLSGVMRVTHGYHLFNGTGDVWTIAEVDGVYRAQTTALTDMKSLTARVIVISNIGKPTNEDAVGTCRNYQKRLWYYPPTGITTVEQFTTWLTEHNLEVVYELAEPIEIQLDAHTLNSLYGQNNIFADTGDTSCEYRADTKLYIDRLTEPDADMIADSNIVSGQYFMVGNNLYLATANIASGGQVIVGTNATRKSLSEALNEINS